MTVEIEGLKDLRKALRDAGEDLGDLRDAGKAAAEIVEGEARPNVPTRTGALVASLRSAGQVGGGVVRAGRAAVPYARFVHFGVPSKSMEPQPFLYDALDERQDDVKASYEKSIAKIAKERGLK